MPVIKNCVEGDCENGALIDEQDREIKRLRLWIRRIDNINDDPAHFSKEIDDACREALAGKPMTGKINAP